jgi:hypothetical protein
MNQHLAKINLDDDLQGLDALGADEAGRWDIQRVGPVELHVTLSPVGDPAERYLARLLWPDYPDQPPSVKFIDPDTGRLDLTCAWPMATGVRPTEFDICVPWTSEAHAIHTEWRVDPNFRWDNRGNALLKVLRSLQDLLDHDYMGRAA